MLPGALMAVSAAVHCRHASMTYYDVFKHQHRFSYIAEIKTIVTTAGLEASSARRSCVTLATKLGTDGCAIVSLGAIHHAEAAAA